MNELTDSFSDEMTQSTVELYGSELPDSATIGKSDNFAILAILFALYVIFFNRK